MSQMNWPILNVGALATTLLIGLLGAMPALAEPLQIAQALDQSDVTGTNPGDIPAPIVEGIIDQNFPTRRVPGSQDGSTGDVTATVVEESERLSAELRDAYADCMASRVAVTDIPRRFARGASSTDTCISVECTQLNELMQEARSFLEGLDNAQRAQIQQGSTLQLW